MACQFGTGSFDQPDSLEGWVAVKEDPFACNTIPPRLLFLVSWNDIERKIAVTVRLRNRVVSDTEEHHGRTGLFSFQELRGIHDLLSLVHPSLSAQLPELPEEPRGLWAFVSYQETPENIDDICEHLQTIYFPIALEICREQLLMSTMFEEHGHDEYFENISELRRQGYEQAIKLAEEELKNVLFERDNVCGMSEMADVYRREDDAIFKLNIALAELYNYQIQPFLDLREVACMRVREAKREIQNPDVGERIKREYCAQLMEWQQHYEEALDVIQDTYMKYYAKTKSIFQGILRRLEKDKKRFGPMSFGLVAQERLYRVTEDMILENLQYLNNKRKKYVQERDKVKETIASMDERPGIRKELERLENQVFDWQQKIYDLHLETMAEEEKLVKTQRDAITRVIKDKEEEMVFYDAVEDVEQLSDEEEMPSLMITDPRLKAIRDKLKSIQTRRAKLRTKQLGLREKVQGKETRTQDEIDRVQQHHAIQRRRDQHKEKLEKKQDFIVDQRKKTIDRLKNFKMKYPTPATIKPPRYQSKSKQTVEVVKTTLRAGPTSIRNTKDKSKATGSQAKVADKDKKLNSTYSANDKKPVPKPRSGSKGAKDLTDGPVDVPVTIFVKGDPTSDTDNSVVPSLSQADSASQSSSAPPQPPSTLKKTESSLQSHQKKQEEEGSGAPNLTSIQGGLKALKPAADRPDIQKPKAADPMQEMFSLIKKGVKLKSMKDNPKPQSEAGAEQGRALQSPSEDHMKLLVESLNRISMFTRDSSPESDSDDGEFDD